MANEHLKGRTFRQDLERLGMALNSAQVLHVLYRKLPYITQQSQLFNPM